MNSTINIEKYKKRLEDILAKLEDDLAKVGFRSGDNPDDWVPKQDELNVMESDENEVADKMEEFENNSASLRDLEIRYNEVKAALQRIEDGTFGIDETDGKPIPEERLDVNPAARTKVENAHIHEPLS